ncbi:ThiF family adenylyltransferase [Aeromonas media]|uniref:ThiF family adenylyltransferase n=1 Tax=Aeromonas media TaxID=651 RepID=UPI003D003725
MIEYFELGERLDLLGRDNLYQQTTSIINACNKNSFISVRELRFSKRVRGRRHSEYIIIDAADGTVAFGNPAGIRRKERLAIEVNPDLDFPIQVHALRKDFPILSHQYDAGAPNNPRILCLYESSWEAVQRNWTPERYLQRILWWLRESAEQRLHRDDQPLEQLFYISPYQLILPANHLEYINSTNKKFNLQTVSRDRQTILRAVPENSNRDGASVRLLTILVPPVETNSVATYPDNLGKLEELLNDWGSELAKPLTDTVYEAIPDTGLIPISGEGEALLILLFIPRLRNGVKERTDVMGYIVQNSLFELANALEILAPKDVKGISFRARLIGGPISKKWHSLPLIPVEIRSAMNAFNARDISAIDHDSALFNGVLAGVGALGSTLADIWIRAGWGRWTYIDPDKLLPHNLSRHVGIDIHVGYPKASILQDLAESIYPHESVPKAINKSILDKDSDIERAINDANVIVDVSTTLEVPRTLALRDNIPRTVSLFLTPSGHSSVMLMEDIDRNTRIDALEGQYYRAILSREWGNNHLNHSYGDRWVGGGCRDISVRMSNECIHVHAGILSRQLRQSILKNDARVCIWESNEISGAVDAHEIELYPMVSVNSGEWVVKYDHGLAQKWNDSRSRSLPNETGGAILGVTDFKNKTIILVDVLPEPTDSQSSPTFFIRGEVGQQEALERVHNLTAHVVSYVGDWHSHPQGYSARASSDDEVLITKLHQKMSIDGLPAVMVIVAENEINIIVR